MDILIYSLINGGLGSRLECWKILYSMGSYDLNVFMFNFLVLLIDAGLEQFIINMSIH